MFRAPSVRRAGVVVAAVLAVLAAQPAPVEADGGLNTQLNAADMTLLNGVRQAGLWEIPAGQMAAQKGSSARVRQIGQMIAQQHVQLDQLTVDAANKLGATLPSTPTAQQQGFLTQLQNANGVQFDQTFVTLLRGTHGFIFPVICAVRVSTRNPVIRRLADQANVFVTQHMQMLESTGLVQYQRLPPAAMPAGQDLSAVGMAEVGAGVKTPVSPALPWLLFAAIMLMATVITVQIVRGRRRAPDVRPYATQT